LYRKQEFRDVTTIQQDPHAWQDHWEATHTNYLYRTRVHDLGHGQKEVLISRSDRWAETPEWAYASKTQKEKDESNSERSARRAKSEIRRKCKYLALDSMITLTYKVNMLDEDTCKKHLHSFIERLKKVVNGFAYIAAFERQTRGAWHIHIACHRIQSHFMQSGVRVKSFDLLRSIWRSVVGEFGGNADLQNRKKRSRKSIAQLAAYISKYVSKSFDAVGVDRLWKKRYTSSRGCVPAAVVTCYRRESLRELISLAIDKYASGIGVKIRACLVDDGKGFFMTIEPDIPSICP
jgi:hypothetical protein